jgi:hypothetical protein
LASMPSSGPHPSPPRSARRCGKNVENEPPKLAPAAAAALGKEPRSFAMYLRKAGEMGRKRPYA